MNEGKKIADVNGQDPVVGMPTHPIAGGVGALGGAAAGATIGMGVGPAGAVVGGVLGALVGGLGGDAVAEAFNEADEADYWRETYSKRPYVAPHASYDDYEPAYKLGVDAYGRYPTQRFDDFQDELSHEWAEKRGSSRLQWDDALPATRDAWSRLSQR